MTEVFCPTLHEWIFYSREAKSQGHLLRRLDWGTSHGHSMGAHIGLHDVDANIHYVFPLTRVKERHWSLGLVQGTSWESVQMSVDMSEKWLTDHIRTHKGREMVALRLSGRVRTSEDAPNETLGMLEPGIVVSRSD